MNSGRNLGYSNARQKRNFFVLQILQNEKVIMETYTRISKYGGKYVIEPKGHL
jgi:hypothetical protein